MAFIKVTPDELRTQGSQVATGAKDVQEVLTRLLTQVRDLAERWEGSGSAAFQNLFDEWNRGAEMTRQGMEGIAQFLNDAAAKYEETDAAVGQAARG